jgi:hypothetical protein
MVVTDESAQTNGVPTKPEPTAGLLDKSKAQEEEWTVERGMS